MERVVPWSALQAQIAPHYPKAGRGRHPYPLETMLRIQLLQQWYALSDPAMEEALYEIVSMRQFAGVQLSQSIPDETTILHLRHLLEVRGLGLKLLETVNAHLVARGLMMRQGTMVDATIINAPSSTKNTQGTRDAEMHQTKKGNQYYFGMKAHIGVDRDSGLVHTVVGTAANVSDVTMTAQLLHGEETQVFADAGYTGAHKREELKDKAIEWEIATRCSKLKALAEGSVKQAWRHLETLRAQVRARVEHRFRVIKQQFGHSKVRYRGLFKNTAQLQVMFALAKLWLVRKRLLARPGQVCLGIGK